MKTLSDEIQKNGNSSWGDDFIWVDDIKEFIKELNKIDFYLELCNKLGKAKVWSLTNDEVCDKLEGLMREIRFKLAGDKLC